MVRLATNCRDTCSLTRHVGFWIHTPAEPSFTRSPILLFSLKLSYPYPSLRYCLSFPQCYAQRICLYVSHKPSCLPTHTHVPVGQVHPSFQCPRWPTCRAHGPVAETAASQAGAHPKLIVTDRILLATGSPDSMRFPDRHLMREITRAQRLSGIVASHNTTLHMYVPRVHFKT